jgi:hypothetical protein
MNPETHNGFILKYNGPIYPASRSNQITYECFCLMGGLSNGRLSKIYFQNGKYRYYRIDIP